MTAANRHSDHGGVDGGEETNHDEAPGEGGQCCETCSGSVADMRAGDEQAGDSTGDDRGEDGHSDCTVEAVHEGEDGTGDEGDCGEDLVESGM